MLSYLSRLFGGGRSGAYAIHNRQVTQTAECSVESLSEFLSRVEVVMVPQDEGKFKFNDPTRLVLYSLSKDNGSRKLGAASGKQPSLLKVLLAVLTEEDEAGRKRFDPDAVITAVRDVALLIKSVPKIFELQSLDIRAALPLSDALAAVDLILIYLQTWDVMFSQEFRFYKTILFILGDLWMGVERLGVGIGQSSEGVTMASFNQIVARMAIYLRNLSMYIVAFNTKRASARPQDYRSMPVGFFTSRSMSTLVSMLSSLSSCVLITREWSNPSTAAAIAMIFWISGEAVTCAVSKLSTLRQKYVQSGAGQTEFQELHKNNPFINSLKVLGASNVISGLEQAIFRSIAVASPVPNEILAGVSRLVIRPSSLSIERDGYDGSTSWEGSYTRWQWFLVAHTTIGFRNLIRSASVFASAERLLFPRHNEWITALSESLVFGIANAHKSRDLALLTPLLAELLLEICLHQTEFTEDADKLFFEIASFLDTYSQNYKKSRRSSRKLRSKRLRKSRRNRDNSSTASPSETARIRMGSDCGDDDSSCFSLGNSSISSYDLAQKWRGKENVANAHHAHTPNEAEADARRSISNSNSTSNAASHKHQIELKTNLGDGSGKSPSELFSSTLPLKYSTMSPTQSEMRSPPTFMSQTVRLSSSTNSAATLKTALLKEGDAIDGQIALQSGSKRWFPGKIVAVNADETYDVVYDDGEKEFNKSSVDLRLSKKRPGMSRPQSKQDLTLPSPAATSTSSPMSPSPLTLNSNGPSILSVDVSVDSPPRRLPSLSTKAATPLGPPLHAVDPFLKDSSPLKIALPSPTAVRSDATSPAVSSPMRDPAAPTSSRRSSNASSGGGCKDEDEDLVFDIPSVFAEADLNRRLHSADDVIPTMNLTAIDQFSMAAVNRASTTSLSGALVKDMESTNMDESASSCGDSQGDEQAEVIVTYEEIERAKDVLQHKIALSEQQHLAYVSSLHLLESQMDAQLGRPPVHSNNESIGTIDGDRTRRTAASAPVTDNSRSTNPNPNPPPKPVIPPLDGQMLAAREVISRINAAPSYVGASSGRLSVNSDYSEVAFLDPECQRALGRTYQFIALILLGRISARGSRLDDKFFNSLNPAVSARSNHSSFLHRIKSGDSSEASWNMKYHQNVVFTVRDYLHNVARGSSLQFFLTDSKLVDAASFRLMKLLSEHFFDMCLPTHLDTAERLAEGAFGNVYKITCPATCDRCFKWGIHQRSRKCSDASQATSNAADPSQMYAVKRVNRERSVYDVSIINDIFTEVTCLEMLSNHRGVCHLYNFGVYSGEYWIVMELCELSLLQWREDMVNSLKDFINGADVPIGTPAFATSIVSFMSVALALFEDACIIVKNVHQTGIVHFDIKCSNFLIKGNPGIVLDWWRRRSALLQKGKDEAFANKNFWIPSGVLLLTDFGESVIFPVNEADTNTRGASSASGVPASPLKRQHSAMDKKYVELNRARGTLCIQSPEMLVISNQPKESTLRELNRKNSAAPERVGSSRTISVFPPPSYSSDIWSLGCVLVELVTGTPLFSDRPWPELYCLLCMSNQQISVSQVVEKCLEAVTEGDISYPITFLVDLKALVMSMLRQDPTTRPSIGNTVARLSEVIRVHFFPHPTEDELEVLANPKEHVKAGAETSHSDISADVVDTLRTDSTVNDVLKLTDNTVCISPKVYLSFSSRDEPFGYDMAHKVFERYNTDHLIFYQQSPSDALTDMIDQIIYDDRTMSIESLPSDLVYRSLNHVQKGNKLTEIVLIAGNAECESESVKVSPEAHATGCLPWSRKSDKIGNVSKGHGRMTPEDPNEEISGVAKVVTIYFSSETLMTFADQFQIALKEAGKALEQGDTVLITVRSVKTPLHMISQSSSTENNNNNNLSAIPSVTLPPKPGARGRTGTSTSAPASSSGPAIKSSRVAVDADGSVERSGQGAASDYKVGGGGDATSVGRDKEKESHSNSNYGNFHNTGTGTGTNIYSDLDTPSNSARDLTARAAEMSAFWKPMVCAATALACSLVDRSTGRHRRSEHVHEDVAGGGSPIAPSDPHPLAISSSSSSSSLLLGCGTTSASTTTTSASIDCAAYLDAVDKAAPWILKQCPRDFLVMLLEYSFENN